MNKQFENITIVKPVVLISLKGFFYSVVMLFCVVSTLFYKTIQDRNSVNFEARVAISYLSVKIQQLASIQDIEVRVEDNISVVIIKENIFGEIYETRIFCDGEYLKENFVHESTPFLVEEGNDITSMREAEFEFAESGVFFIRIVNMKNDEFRIAFYFQNGGVAI